MRDGLEKPRKKPDADNIGKIILDSLNGIAYKDDSQIIELSVIKSYTEDDERIKFKLI
ncbi:RusA family crossover junction endodeoxyribonuclease [Clostridium perfringens]